MDLSLLHFLAANQLALGACAAAVFGLYVFFCGFRLLIRRPTPDQASKLTISAAAPGPATITATATGTRTLAAPITGKECYLYRTSIWHRDTSGKNEWKNLAEETGHLSFLIQDATGVMPVEPQGAEFDLRHTFTGEYAVTPSSSNQGDIPDPVAAFLARHGITPDRPIRIVESCLEPGSSVFVSGILSENSSQEGLSDASVRARKEASSAARSAQDQRNDGRMEAVSPAPKPEVIRLSSSPAPTSTTLMTQQQKIAAALSRAGLAGTDVWTSPETPAPKMAAESLIVSAGAESNDYPVAPTPAVAHKSDSAFHSAFASRSVSGLRMAKGADDVPFFISNHAQRDFPAFDWRSIALVVTGTSLTVLGILIFGHLHWLP